MCLWQGRRQCQGHGSARAGGAWGPLGSTGADTAPGEGCTSGPRVGRVGSSQFQLTPWLLHSWVSPPRGIHKENATLGGSPPPTGTPPPEGEAQRKTFEFPEGGDDGSMSPRARGGWWQLVPTCGRSGVTPTLAAASPAASCTAALEQLPVGHC